MKDVRNVPALRPAPVAAPRLTVAHGWSGPSAPLGLDRTLPLLGGGGRLMPSGLASETGLEHMPVFRTLVATACRKQTALGLDFFAQDPVALIGPAGVGRGLAARWLSRMTGVPLVRLDERWFDLRGGEEAWTSERRMPPPPAVAIAASGCANPIVLLEVGEDVSDRTAASIGTMINDRTNSRWLGDGLDYVLDLGRVTWIVQSPALPTTLERTIGDCGTIIDVEHPRGIATSLRNLSIAMETPIDGSDEHGPIVFEALENAVARSGDAHAMGCARLCALARQVAREGRGIGQ